MRDFLDQTGLVRDRFRESVPGMNVRGLTGKTVNSLQTQPARGQAAISTAKQAQNKPTSVGSDIETYLSYTGTKAEVREAYAEINKVHRCLCQHSIPVTDNERMFALGRLNYIGNRPTAIELRPNGDHPIMTALHEAGHFIDISGIDKIGEFAENKIGTTLKDWWKAITESASYKGLKGAKIASAHDCARVKYIDYLLNPDELWARSYAQYIATKSTHQTLKGELNDMLKLALDLQWKPDDFHGIEKAFDDLFSKLGWLK